MNFRFQIGKVTEAACEFLERAGGRINVMKLVKLLYLLDRVSTVAYSTCKCGPAVAALEAAIKRVMFTEIAPPPPSVLRRIIEGALVSKGMPPLARQWLAVVP